MGFVLHPLPVPEEDEPVDVGADGLLHQAALNLAEALCLSGS